MTLRELGWASVDVVEWVINWFDDLFTKLGNWDLYELTIGQAVFTAWLTWFSFRLLGRFCGLIIYLNSVKW